MKADLKDAIGTLRLLTAQQNQRDALKTLEIALANFRDSNASLAQRSARVEQEIETVKQQAAADRLRLTNIDTDLIAVRERLKHATDETNQLRSKLEQTQAALSAANEIVLRLQADDNPYWPGRTDDGAQVNAAVRRALRKASPPLKEKPLPPANVVSPRSDHKVWTEASVRGMMMNPIYAGLGPYPAHLSDRDWVSGCMRILAEDGPEQFLVNMLWVLRSTFRYEEETGADMMALSRCKRCGAYIKIAYGNNPPADHMDHAGTEDDPRSPGDRDDICDVCEYGSTKRDAP